MNLPRSRPLENRYGHGVEGLILAAFIGVIAAIALPMYDKYGGMVVAIVVVLVLGAIFFLLDSPGYFVLDYIIRPALLNVRSLTAEQEISLEEYAARSLHLARFTASGAVSVSMLPFTNSGFGSEVNWDIFQDAKSTLEDKITFRVKDSVMALVKEKL